MREKNIRTKEKHQFLEVGKDTKLAKAEEYGFLTDVKFSHCLFIYALNSICFKVRDKI